MSEYIRNAGWDADPTALSDLQLEVQLAALIHSTLYRYDGRNKRNAEYRYFSADAAQRRTVLEEELKGRDLPEIDHRPTFERAAHMPSKGWPISEPILDPIQPTYQNHIPLGGSAPPSNEHIMRNP